MTLPLGRRGHRRARPVGMAERDAGSIRKERPHPRAQWRFTDADGLRLTAFATNTPRGQMPDLELRHRRRARAEDRIRAAKTTGLTNLPLHGFAHNRIWVATVALAPEPHRLDPDARPDRPRSPAAGAQTPAASGAQTYPWRDPQTILGLVDGSG